MDASAPDAQSLDVIEFLQISRCELQQIVAERNSVLGKLAEPSYRLAYELRFLELGETCLDLVGDDHPALAQTLRQTLEQKRAHLPALVWRATLGGPEFRLFWQAGNGPLPEGFESGGETELALTRLIGFARGWLGGDYHYDVELVEASLRTISRARAGQLLKGWTLLGARLDVATRILEARAHGKPLCFPGMKTRDADIFYNVVRADFVGDIQVWAASLNSRYYELMPPVRDLESLLAVGEPATYASWRGQRDAALDSQTSALARHVQALNPLLDQCGLLPTVPGQGEA